MKVVRGHLAAASTAPSEGERIDTLVDNGDLAVEHIVSGSLPEPLDYDQHHDEWVAVLEGTAELDVDGELLELTAGDWLLLPKRTPHRLIRTERGTRWLAVRFNA